MGRSRFRYGRGRGNLVLSSFPQAFLPREVTTTKNCCQTIVWYGANADVSAMINVSPIGRVSNQS
eukprot:scaffold4223_cov189-Amphora_coffeaeformis.AAC.26